MKEFQEGSLKISFDDTWTCEKWDGCSSFRQGIGKLNGRLLEEHKCTKCNEKTGCEAGTKAVDFLGVRNNNVYLIEIKDFRTSRIPNKDRHEEDLPLEIALKVRDTLAGVIGASVMKTDDTLAQECVRIFGRTNDGGRVYVIAWILEDRNMPDKDHMRAAVRRKQLASKLRWLTTKVLDGNPLVDPQVSGVRVERLKQAE